MWQLEVELSEGVVHQYRYCVVLQLPDQTTIVRRWETHLLPRQVPGGGGGGGGDVFGRDGAGRVRVQRGWLAEEVLLTLKLVGPSAVTLYRYNQSFIYNLFLLPPAQEAQEAGGQDLGEGDAAGQGGHVRGAGAGVRGQRQCGPHGGQGQAGGLASGGGRGMSFMSSVSYLWTMNAACTHSETFLRNLFVF